MTRASVQDDLDAEMLAMLAHTLPAFIARLHAAAEAPDPRAALLGK